MLSRPSIQGSRGLASALRGRRILLKRRSLSTLFGAVTEVILTAKTSRSRRPQARCRTCFRVGAFYRIRRGRQVRILRNEPKNPNRDNHLPLFPPPATLPVTGSGCVLYGFPPSPARGGGKNISGAQHRGLSTAARRRAAVDDSYKWFRLSRPPPSERGWHGRAATGSNDTGCRRATTGRSRRCASWSTPHRTPLPAQPAPSGPRH